MKAIILTDIHLGKYKYGRINHETGIDLRTEDILRNFDKCIDYGIENGAQYCFILGDFYHTKRPQEVFRKLLAARIDRLLESNIETFLLLGNHDQGRTSGHDLVELSALSNHIELLHVIDEPESFVKDDAVFCFVPHVNRVDHNIKQDDEHNYFLSSIESLTREAAKHARKHKLLFGHFGTSESVLGNSLDLGTVETKAKKISTKSFDGDVWTKVYLGHIHQHQEITAICRHPGSIARVDFGEEKETKGFYWIDNRKEKFVDLEDREFKTLQVDLIKKPRATMKEFCDDVQDLDLSECIVRLKVKIRASDKKLVNFDALDKYLREACWNYIGKTITEVTRDTKQITLDNSEELDHVRIFEQYVDGLESELSEFKDLKEEGLVLLSEALNV